MSIMRIEDGGPTDGGPAFPVWADAGDHIDDGMSLRDYFAAKAMVRLTGADPDGIHSADTLAMLSYRLADAMLKARQP